jgi:hypothetical protein
MPSASFRNKQKLTFRPARREDGDVVNVELDIDTNGYRRRHSQLRFTTPRELGKILSAAPQCQQCVAKQLFRYYTGRHENCARRRRHRSGLCRFPQLRVPVPGADGQLIEVEHLFPRNPKPMPAVHTKDLSSRAAPCCAACPVSPSACRPWPPCSTPTAPPTPAPSTRLHPALRRHLVQRQTASPKSIGFPPKPAPIS